MNHHRASQSISKSASVRRALVASLLFVVVLLSQTLVDNPATAGGDSSGSQAEAGAPDWPPPPTTPTPDLYLQQFYQAHEIERAYRADYLHLATGNASDAQAHGVYDWPFALDSIGHSIASYQLYGGAPYFHHGLDVMAPDGTNVFTRAGGQIINIENYQPGNDLYWEVAVLDADGFIWQFHHIDVDTIPQAIWDKWYEYQDDPLNGGFVTADTYIGDIVYWPVVSFGKRFNHIHLNVLGAGGAYLNGFEFHTPLADDDVPEIQAIGLLQDGEIYTDNEISGSYSVYVRARDLVLDDVYHLPPYEVTVAVDGGPPSTVWRFDTLPGGADREAYVMDYCVVPPTCGNYTCRDFYIDLGFMISGQRVFPSEPGEHEVLVAVRDYAQNEASLSYTWTVEGPPTPTSTPTVTPIPPMCMTAIAGMDSYLKQDKVNDNKGDDSDVRIKTELNKLQRTVLWFDLPALPVGANVQSATLSLWLASVRNLPVDVHARQLLESWAEYGVTWNDRDEGAGLPWTTPGGTYSGSIIDTTTVDQPKDSWVSWDMMAVIDKWLAGENKGVILESPADPRKPELKFRSRETGDETQRPRLEICYHEAPPIPVPAVHITNPADGETVAGTIGVTAAASDPDGEGVSQVEFFVDGESIGVDGEGADGWSASWDTSTVADGPHTVSATATNTIGETATDSISVEVDNVDDLPTMAITYPSEGATVAGSVTVTADADDDHGVERVEFLVNGASIGMDSDGADGWSAIWDTTANPDPIYAATVSATATDTVGQTASDHVAVTVDNTDHPPLVAITDPADGETVSGIVIVTADASDGEGVPQVQFFVDGASIGVDVDGSDGWSATWDTTVNPEWIYPAVVSATATDTVGQTATDSVDVTVDNTPKNPTCVVLEPGKNLGYDAYLKQDNPDDRKGGDSEMRVKTEAGKLQRALTRFDLSAVPGDATVASVRLWLWVKDLNGPAVELNAHRVLESWNEPQVSWADRDKEAHVPWAVAGGTYDAEVVDSATISAEKVWASWDLSALGAGWLVGDNYGVILEAPVSDPKTEVKFVSNDDGDADERPWLEVCYYP